MPGVPGKGGPVPKHSSERRRRNADSQVETASPVTGRVRVPTAPKGLHPLARDWYNALKASGQSRFYEPSDWATAKVHAEALSRLLSCPRFSAQAYAAWNSAAQELLTTEGARRRVRLEIERAPEKPKAAAVSVLSDYRTG